MEIFKEFIMLLGRLCISLMFLWTAYEKVRDYNNTMSYMKSKHVPKPQIFVPAFLSLNVLGALMIFFGWYAQLGALFLLLTTVFSIAKFHQFWKIQGQDKNHEISKFRKELAIAGGLLLLLAIGAGGISI